MKNGIRLFTNDVWFDITHGDIERAIRYAIDVASEEDIAEITASEQKNFGADLWVEVTSKRHGWRVTQRVIKIEEVNICWQ